MCSSRAWAPTAFLCAFLLCAAVFSFPLEGNAGPKVIKSIEVKSTDYASYRKVYRLPVKTPEDAFDAADSVKANGVNIMVPVGAIELRSVEIVKQDGSREAIFTHGAEVSESLLLEFPSAAVKELIVDFRPRAGRMRPRVEFQLVDTKSYLGPLSYSVRADRKPEPHATFTWSNAGGDETIVADYLYVTQVSNWVQIREIEIDVYDSEAKESKRIDLMPILKEHYRSQEAGTNAPDVIARHPDRKRRVRFAKDQREPFKIPLQRNWEIEDLWIYADVVSKGLGQLSVRYEINEAQAAAASKTREVAMEFAHRKLNEAGTKFVCPRTQREEECYGSHSYIPDAEAVIKGKKITLTNSNDVKGRIRSVTITYVNGSVQRFAQISSGHILAKTGETLELPLDYPDVAIASIVTTATSDVGRQPDSPERMQVTLTVPDRSGVQESMEIATGAEAVWNVAETEERTVKARTLAIQSEKGKVVISSFVIEYADGEKVDLNALGEEQNELIMNEDRHRLTINQAGEREVFPLFRDKAITAIYVKGFSYGSREPARIRVTLGEKYSTESSQICMDEDGNAHSWNSLPWVKKFIEDGRAQGDKDLCSWDELEEYPVYEVRRTYRCIDGKVKEVEAAFERELLYTSGSTPGQKFPKTKLYVNQNNPGPWRGKEAPQYCPCAIPDMTVERLEAIGIQPGQDATFIMLDETAAYEDRFEDRAASCPYDAGGVNQYYKLYKYDCQRVIDLANAEEGEIDPETLRSELFIDRSTPYDTRHDLYEVKVACPAARACFVDSNGVYQDLKVTGEFETPIELHNELVRLGGEAVRQGNRRVSHSSPWEENLYDQLETSGPNAGQAMKQVVNRPYACPWWDGGSITRFYKKVKRHTCENGSYSPGRSVLIKDWSKLEEVEAPAHFTDRTECVARPAGNPISVWVSLDGGSRFKMEQFAFVPNSSSDDDRFVKWVSQDHREKATVTLYTLPDEYSDWGELGYLAEEGTIVRRASCVQANGRPCNARGAYAAIRTDKLQRKHCTGVRIYDAQTGVVKTDTILDEGAISVYTERQEPITTSMDPLDRCYFKLRPQVMSCDMGVLTPGRKGSWVREDHYYGDNYATDIECIAHHSPEDVACEQGAHFIYDDFRSMAPVQVAQTSLPRMLFHRDSAVVETDRENASRCYDGFKVTMPVTCRNQALYQEGQSSRVALPATDPDSRYCFENTPGNCKIYDLDRGSTIVPEDTMDTMSACMSSCHAPGYDLQYPNRTCSYKFEEQFNAEQSAREAHRNLNSQCAILDRAEARGEKFITALDNSDHGLNSPGECADFCSTLRQQPYRWLNSVANLACRWRYGEGRGEASIVYDEFQSGYCRVVNPPRGRRGAAETLFPLVDAGQSALVPDKGYCEQTCKDFEGPGNYKRQCYFKKLRAGSIEELIYDGYAEMVKGWNTGRDSEGNNYYCAVTNGSDELRLAFKESDIVSAEQCERVCHAGPWARHGGGGRRGSRRAGDDRDWRDDRSGEDDRSGYKCYWAKKQFHPPLTKRCLVQAGGVDVYDEQVLEIETCRDTCLNGTGMDENYIDNIDYRGDMTCSFGDRQFFNGRTTLKKLWDDKKMNCRVDSNESGVFDFIDSYRVANNGECRQICTETYEFDLSNRCTFRRPNSSVVTSFDPEVEAEKGQCQVQDRNKNKLFPTEGGGWVNSEAACNTKCTEFASDPLRRCFLKKRGAEKWDKFFDLLANKKAMRDAYQSGANSCVITQGNGKFVASFAPNVANSEAQCNSVCQHSYFQTANPARKCLWEGQQFHPNRPRPEPDPVDPTPTDTETDIDDEPTPDPIEEPTPEPEKVACYAGQREKKDLLLHDLGKKETMQQCRQACRQQVKQRRQFCSLGEDGISKYIIKQKGPLYIVENPRFVLELITSKKVTNFFEGGGGGRRGGGGGLGDILDELGGGRRR